MSTKRKTLKLQKARKSEYYHDGNNHSLLIVKNPSVQTIPDEMKVEIPFTLSPGIAFNTSVAGGEYVVYANSLRNIAAATLGTRLYAVGYEGMYQRYRVEQSTIEVRLASREATKSQFVALLPTLSSSVVGGLSGYATYVNLPWSKRATLSPYVGGSSHCVLSQSINMTKFVGTHYRMQDEYAALTGSDPATLIYWKIIFANPDVNTLTSGGCNIQILMRQQVTFYEPLRNSSAT